MEALGLASASKDRAKLEQRLLTAVSDLQLAQKERDQYRDQMMQLSETMLRYLKTAEGGDPQARMDVETQLRSMNALVDKAAKAQPQNGSLLDGSVISVKEEWSFVVGNFGAREGVKIGMPLRVKRGDEVVGSCGWWMCANGFAVRSFRNLERKKLRLGIGWKSMPGQM